jgi:hypothetical protein
MPDLLRIVPQEEQLDAVAKIRVSTPQSLIDTDFEYGLQPTKWEFVYQTNNRATAYYIPTAPLTFTAIAGAGTNVVTVTTATPPAVGTPIYISGATQQAMNGWWIVASVSAGVSFTYNLTSGTVTGSGYDSTKTYVYSGYFYAGAGLTVGTGSGAAFTASTTTVTCTTTYAHGLSVGNSIYVTGTTAATSGPPNGTWVVASVPNANTFTFVVVTAPSGAITATAGATSTLYAAPSGYTAHRAFDGGVQFAISPGAPNASIVRQTRRYFRYQSGKALQMSTGSILKNALYVDSLTASGTTVTVNTRFPHGLTPGCYIKITGATQAEYNGTWLVATAATLSLTVVVNTAPTVTTATGFPIFVSAFSWYGINNRIGVFDAQNGVYFDFDGQTLSAVKRLSTNQISGSVAVTSASNSVVGTSTLFSKQLAPGDYIVIRGMSYRVQSITSDTQLFILPEYRGATSSNCIASKTTEVRIPQSQWNLDKLDGTGPSGYVIDLTKMQMWYIDYSWYGAGFVRWGVRTSQGQIFYCHKLANNNINTEAWMRSGNLPAHYESVALQPTTTLTANVAAGDTTINVSSTTGFPASGAARVTAAGNAGGVEMVTYTGLTSTSLTGLTRAATGGNTAAQTFTYSATAPVAVELANTATTLPSAYPAAGSMSHWGTSVVMDGGFQNDLLFQFTAGMPAQLNVGGNATNALISLRIGPSVDTGFAGLLGAKEVVNRMQLKLSAIRILSAGIFRVSAFLNGFPASGTFASLGGSSLCQIAYHAAATTFSGGEAIYTFYTNNSGGATNLTLTEEDLTLVRDLGNAILGGGTSNTVPTSQSGLYPDGPDVLTLVATNLTGTAANITALLSWTEAQA